MKTIFQRFMSWTRLNRLRNGKRKNGKGDVAPEDVNVPVGTDLLVADPIETESTDLQPFVVAKPMNHKEETIVRLREGFQDLSDLLGNINTNIQDQVETSKGIQDSIEVLPEILTENQRGNDVRKELMGSLLRETSESSLRQKEALQNLRSLPVALAAIQENEIAQYKALAAIKEELAKRNELEREMVGSFSKFGATLDKIGDSTLEQAKQIGKLGTTQKELVSNFHRVQSKTIETFQIAQEKSYDEFKQAQGHILLTFQQGQERMKRKFMWGVGAIAAILAFIAIVVFGLWMRAVNDLSEGSKEVQRRASAIEEKAANLLKDRDKEISRLRSSLAEKSEKEDDLVSSLEKWGKRSD
ncbi:MAG: hypothetical protein ACYTHM_11510 [Planctomycetota bacterium]